MFLQCEICDQVLAKTEKDRLRLPIDTSMFDPPTAEHSNPWPWMQTWLDMKCPYCGSRPFVMSEKEIQDALEHRTEGPNRIKTPQGFYALGDKYAPGEQPDRESPVYEEDELEAEWLKRTGEVVSEVLNETFSPENMQKAKKGWPKGKPRKVF